MSGLPPCRLGLGYDDAPGHKKRPMTAVLDQTAASLARRLHNAIASDGDPHQCQVWDSALVDAVDAARAHGLPLANVVCALQREADERGWL